MKELDNIKKAWKNQDNSSGIQFNKDDIQKMLHKKSSSVVKWIFYISIIEFCFWILISVLVDTDLEEFKRFGLYNFMTFLNIFNYVAIFIFILLFYFNYKTISVASDTHKLMKDILKTRKTVFYYVVYNVAIAIIGLTVSIYHILTNSDFTKELQLASPDRDLSSSLLLATIISVVLIAVFIGLILLFYRLIYGTLLNKLKNNYRELSKN